jgi:hypothetical protein
MAALQIGNDADIVAILVLFDDDWELIILHV